MKTQSPDTSLEAELILIEHLRAAGPSRRLQMACDASRTLRQLAWNGLRHRHPGATEAELRRRYVEVTYGEDAARRLFDESSSK